MKMYLQFVLGALLCFAQRAATAYTVRTIYQFPSNDTWLENLLVTESGKILATQIDPPHLLEFDPYKPGKPPRLIHDFSSDVLGLTGIVETAPGIFYVAGGNLTAKNYMNAPLNSTKLWRVALDHRHKGSAQVDLVVAPKVPEVFNGLTIFNETTLLASDNILFCVWAVDIRTGQYYNATSDPLMRSSSGSGVNGLKMRGQYLYFTSGTIFARVKLNPDTSAAEPAKQLASAPWYDDFGFDRRTGVAYAANAFFNTVQRIDPDGTSSFIAGNLNSTEVAEPTSAAVGRTRGFLKTVFITTGGGSSPPIIVNGVATSVGAQLLAIEMD